MTFDWKQYFAELPCNEALDWIEENGIETMSEAWEKCHRGDWLVWALEHRSDEYALTGKQRVEIAVKLIRETPIGDGRTVYDLLTDKRSINTIEVAERYVAGEASDEELREAAKAARAAAWAAEWAAAWAADAEAGAEAGAAADAVAAWAASAAADEAADAAADAAAAWAADAAASAAVSAAVVWEESVAATTARKAQADIIREWWPAWVPEQEIAK